MAPEQIMTLGCGGGSSGATGGGSDAGASEDDERSVRSLETALRDRATRLDGDPRFELFELQAGYVSGRRPRWCPR